MKKIVITSICAAALLMACSKKDEAPPVSLKDASSPTAVKAAVEEKRAATAPKADKSIPLEQYQELDSGKQLLFAYIAFSGMPLDYNNVASQISKEYARESDDFKKRDLLEALKPSIDKEVAKAKETRYFYMDMDENVGNYDFDAKAFPIPALADSKSIRYFYDLNQYQLTFANSDAFNKLSVTDESTARTIEGLRTKYSAIKTRVYFTRA